MTVALIEISGYGGAVIAFVCAAAYWRYGDRLMAFSLGDTPRAKEFAHRWAHRVIGYRTAGTVVLVFMGVSALHGAMQR